MCTRDRSRHRRMRAWPAGAGTCAASCCSARLTGLRCAGSQCLPPARSKPHSAPCRSTATRWRCSRTCRRSSATSAPTRPSTRSKSICRSCSSCWERSQLVPLVVGAASTEDVAAVLERLWGDDSDADRRQLRSLALPQLRRRTPSRPRHARGGAAAGAEADARPGLRRDAGQRPARARPSTRDAGRTARPAQFRRHGRRPDARRRLRRGRVLRACRCCGLG